MDIYNTFERENHLKPDFDKIAFETLSGWDLGWEILETINIAESPADDKELSKRFSPGQKALYFFWYLDAAVTNGGFIQFYWNELAYLLPTIKEGLKLINDTDLLHLLELADGYYKSVKIQFDELRSTNNYAAIGETFELFEMYDDQYYRIHDDTMELLEKYIKSYPDNFVNLI